MGGLRPWHIIVLVVVVLVLFGAKRLPDGARAIGRSLRIFKAETKGLMEDDVRGKAEAKTTSELKDDEPSDVKPEPRPLDGEVIDPPQRGKNS
ncbi:MAG TPA: Sec-independent protein translocase subunit TatA [Mycobacteriales bacterium]|jgi:sec-independent protein translocase protein TatA|nr:Sec-independent protein translocase subunit TatA [Mycobacteriales bacterium]